MLVSYLPEPEKHLLWNDIKELLKPAVIDGEVLDEHELVWIAFDGPIVFASGTTALLTDGTAEIRACGGTRHREWVEQALEIVEAWARDAGASRLTMRGRRGWARYLRAGWDCLGTEDGQTVFEKDLRG